MIGEAAWEGGFHAVSSFNNAGFSLYSDNLIGLATAPVFYHAMHFFVFSGRI